MFAGGLAISLWTRFVVTQLSRPLHRAEKVLLSAIGLGSAACLVPGAIISSEVVAREAWLGLQYVDAVPTRLGMLLSGLYGVALGAAFFGESMFSRETDASKVALVELVERLKRGNFMLLDTQFLTEHLARFGTREIPREDYRRLLEEAIVRDAAFPKS